MLVKSVSASFAASLVLNGFLMSPLTASAHSAPGIVDLNSPQHAVVGLADEDGPLDELERSLVPPAAGHMLGRGILPVSKAVNLDIRFVSGSATLGAESRRTLTRLATVMKRLGPHGVRFSIEGFASSSGTASVNRELGRKRALAVKRFLLEKGVTPDLIVHSRAGVMKAGNGLGRDDSSARRVRIISHFVRG